LVSGGSKEREEYFNFLKSGGSRYPVEALALAGVDMEKSEPIQAACDAFKGILSELETLLRKGAGTPQNQ
jgi:oligoendopeptidase F